MRLETLQCNSCGAPLSVPESVNFVSCNHCGTQLAVRRTADAAYTEKLQRLSRKTEELSEHVRYLAWQNELASLDRRWQTEKIRYMVTDKHGRRREPSEIGSMVGGGIAAVFGLFWTFVAAGSGAPGFFPLFGLLFVAFGIGIGIYGFNKAKEYRAAYRRYRRQRAALTPETVDLSRHNQQRIFEGVEPIPTPQEYLAQLEREHPGRHAQ